MKEDQAVHKNYCNLFKRLMLKNPEHYKSLIEAKLESQNEEIFIV